MSNVGRLYEAPEWAADWNAEPEGYWVVRRCIHEDRVMKGSDVVGYHRVWVEVSREPCGPERYGQQGRWM